MRRTTDPLRHALAGLAAIASLAALPAAAQEAPVRLGMVFAKQGSFTENGTALATGADLAVQQAHSKVLGRPIELIWYDEANPQMAQQNFDKLAEQDKVVGVVGGSNSATALAMAASARQSKVPFIAAGPAAREITGKDCNRYTFRVLSTVQAASAALVPAMLANGKDWYFVVSAYAYGQDTHNTLKAELTKAGGREVGVDMIPGGTTDFSSVILKIRQAKPSMVVTSLGGADLIPFLKQYSEFGLDKTIPVMSPLVSDSHMWALGEHATGLFGKPWQYSDPSNSDAEKAFVKAYTDKIGKPPSVEAWEGWISMRMLLAAIEEAKSTDAKAVVKTLETMKLANGTTPTYFRSWDHQLIHPLLVVRGRAPPANDKWDMLETLRKVPPNNADLETVFGTQAEIGCTLGDF